MKYTFKIEIDLGDEITIEAENGDDAFEIAVHDLQEELSSEAYNGGLNQIDEDEED